MHLFLAPQAGRRLKGCTARIVPNHSAFRKHESDLEEAHPFDRVEGVRVQELVLIPTAFPKCPPANSGNKGVTQYHERYRPSARTGMPAGYAETRNIVFPEMASTIDSLLMRSLPMPGSISVIAHHIISRTMLRGFCLFCLGAVVSIQPGTELRRQ